MELISLRRVVAYVTHGAGTKPIGTAFFVDTNGTGATPYAVTAAHVIQSSQIARLHLRLVIDGAETLDVPVGKWSALDEADIAVASFNHERKLFATVDLESDSANEAWRREHAIDVGSPISTVGLFINESVTQGGPDWWPIRPLYRFGHISMMRDEPIRVELGGQETLVDAYVANIVTTPGHSGSPAFVLDSAAAGAAAPRSGQLLGIVAGHWTVIAARITNNQSEMVLQVPSGLSVVTPVEYISKAIDLSRHRTGST